MAITTYTELVAAVTDMLQSPNIIGQIDTWIGLVEDDVRVRVPATEINLPFTVANGEIPLPSDFMEVQNINLDYPQGKYPLEALTDQYIDWATFEPRGRKSKYYAIQGDKIRFEPALEGATGTLQYHRRLLGLSLTQQTNWLIVERPNVYWYGVLLHGFERKRDWDSMGRYSTLFAGVLGALEREGKRKKYAGQGRRMRGR